MVYLIGDIRQLPPVTDHAAHSTKLVSEAAINGYVLFRSLQKSLWLEVIQRQAGNDPEQHSFRAALENRSVGESNMEDYEKFYAQRKWIGQAVAAFTTAFRVVSTVRVRTNTATIYSKKLADQLLAFLRSITTGAQKKERMRMRKVKRYFCCGQKRHA